MSKQGDGLTGYTLANGYGLGPWERHGLDADTRARHWKKRGEPKKLAAVARRASWSIHRSVEGWHYDNSGGCASLKEGKTRVDDLLRGVTERMDWEAERDANRAMGEAARLGAEKRGAK